MTQFLMHIGFAPIQIIAAATLDALSEKDLCGEVIFFNVSKMLVCVTEFLVLNGARLSLEAPPFTRSGENRQSSRSNISDNSTGDGGSEENFDPSRRSHLKIQSNKELMKILGTQGVSEAQKVWKNLSPPPAPSSSILHTDKSAIENSTAPGGSDDKSCAICWKAFGLLVRKHRCRVSQRFVCDECSSQRIVGNGEEHRVSDGQFLLAKAEEVIKAKKKLGGDSKHSISTSQQPLQNATAARLDRLESEENANRESLFGGIMATVAKAFTEEDGTSQLSQADTISGLSAQLSQTRDALNERGDKLSGLADKSDKLVSASQDFAAMARELNRKSNQGFFSW
jgi:hypothetical protein